MPGGRIRRKRKYSPVMLRGGDVLNDVVAKLSKPGLSSLFSLNGILLCKIRIFRCCCGVHCKKSINVGAIFLLTCLPF